MSKREQVIFIPYAQVAGELNPYTRKMQEIWMKKYEVVRKEQVSTNIPSILKTKFIVLNWVENDLNFIIKFELLLYRLLGVKIIWTFHNKVPHDSQSKEKDIIWLQRISNYIVLHSKSSKSDIDSKYRRKAIYIPHPIYDKKNNLSIKINLEDNINEGDFVFSFLGLVRPYKNIELVIQIFNELKLRDAKLLICGKPYDRKYAKTISELVKSNSNIVFIPRFLSDSEMEYCLEKTDVSVLPYKLDSSINSGALILNFSYKKTVIISSIPMAMDFEKEKFLYVYDNKNEYEELKKCMLLAYEEGKEKNSIMGNEAYQFVKRENGILKIEKIINEIS